MCWTLIIKETKQIWENEVNSDFIHLVICSYRPSACNGSHYLRYFVLILQLRLNVGQEPCESQGEDSESGFLAFSRAFHNLPFPSKNEAQYFLQSSKNVEILKPLNLWFPYKIFTGQQQLATLCLQCIIFPKLAAGPGNLGASYNACYWVMSL